jgi:hypothetical protein
VQYLHSDLWVRNSTVGSLGNRREKLCVFFLLMLADGDSSARFLAGAGNFSFHYCVRNGFEAHSISYPMGSGGVALSLRLKRPGREADHSPHLVPRSRMRGSIPPLPNTSSWRGA